MGLTLEHDREKQKIQLLLDEDDNVFESWVQNPKASLCVTVNLELKLENKVLCAKKYKTERIVEIQDVENLKKIASFNFCATDMKDMCVSILSLTNCW